LVEHTTENRGVASSILALAIRRTPTTKGGSNVSSGGRQHRAMAAMLRRYLNGSSDGHPEGSSRTVEALARMLGSPQSTELPNTTLTTSRTSGLAGRKPASPFRLDGRAGRGFGGRRSRRGPGSGLSVAGGHVPADGSGRVVFEPNAAGRAHDYRRASAGWRRRSSPPAGRAQGVRPLATHWRGVVARGRPGRKRVPRTGAAASRESPPPRPVGFNNRALRGSGSRRPSAAAPGRPAASCRSAR
jgi:hypothetical protein